jgi:Notch-like protein
VFIGVVLVLLASLLIGVLVAAQRKRAQGITWFPEGFFRNNRFAYCTLISSHAYALVW